MLEEEKKANKEKLINIIDKKKQAKTFRQKLAQYNKPAIYVCLGLIFAFISGLIAPLFGLLIMKNLSAIMFADACNKAQKMIAEAIRDGSGSDLNLQDNPFEGSDFECDVGSYNNRGYWVSGESLDIVYEARWWISLMVIAAATMFFTKALTIIYFSKLGNKIIGGVRSEFY